MVRRALLNALATAALWALAAPLTVRVLLWALTAEGDGPLLLGALVYVAALCALGGVIGAVVGRALGELTWHLPASRFVWTLGDLGWVRGSAPREIAGWRPVAGRLWRFVGVRRGGAL